MGVLWGEERALTELKPAKAAGGTVKHVVLEGGRPVPVWLDAPMRHEAGVPNIPGAVAFAEALALVESWDADAVRAHVSSLVGRLTDGIRRVEAVSLVGDPAALAEGSLAALAPRVPGFSVKDFNLFVNHELPGRFIALRAGEHCAHLLHASLGLKETLRVSLFAYNTAAEVDLFLEALAAYAKEAVS
ncbi:MAG: aminotransferase class V-fold PLP-dependent enzyme [Elusimicrobia bacterium]|nr:aminotransferase class V-fold PLP-dependent enzyme [Elusimicrobiota bacterium]